MQGETTGIGGHLGHDVETNAEDNSGIYESDPGEVPRDTEPELAIFYN